MSKQQISTEIYGWKIGDPLDKPCPHRTPNAEGSVASELHGVCIFCWRDRAGLCYRLLKEYMILAPDRG